MNGLGEVFLFVMVCILIAVASVVLVYNDDRINAALEIQAVENLIMLQDSNKELKQSMIYDECKELINISVTQSMQKLKCCEQCNTFNSTYYGYNKATNSCNCAELETEKP